MSLSDIKLKNFSSAYQDCCLVLEVEPNNAKALLRRGTAVENLGTKSKVTILKKTTNLCFLIDFFYVNLFSFQALEDFEAVVRIEPNNKEAKQAIQRLGGVLPQKSVRYIFSFEVSFILAYFFEFL